MTTQPDKRSPSKPPFRAALAAAALALLLFSPSCAKRKPLDKKPSVPDSEKAASAADAQNAAGKVERTPLSADTYSVLAPRALGNIAQSPELTALRKRGVLKAAVKCDRQNLCVTMKYGAQAGFEVELTRKIANDALGVKLNIVDQHDPGADIRLNTSCGPPDGPPQLNSSPQIILAGPYYYSASTGWLCYEVVNGGQPLAAALDRVTAHFYNAGTFQQIFKNWFPPEATDTERSR